MKVMVPDENCFRCNGSGKEFNIVGMCYEVCKCVRAVEIVAVNYKSIGHNLKEPEYFKIEEKAK